MVLGALLHALSMPKFSLFLLGFVFLLPLFHRLETPLKDLKKKRRPFLLFYFFSFFSYLMLLYWIPNVMMQYGGMHPTLSIFGLILMAAFFSLLTGLAGIFIYKILVRAAHDERVGRPFAAVVPLLVIPLTWVTKDLILEYIISGFPWCLTGYSQHQNLYFIQVAEWGGIHLVSFAVIFFNVLFYRLWKAKDNVQRKAVLIALLVSVVGVYSVGYYLHRSARAEAESAQTHAAGIIQPNTNNDPISRARKMGILHRIIQESTELAQQGAEFVVWPEHTVSVYPLQMQYEYQMLNRFVTQANVPLLAGFTDLGDHKKIYNSAVLFEKDRWTKYDKVHLTPFGEYILYRELLFFVKRITDEIADFTPGEAVRNLAVNGHAVSTPICYEIIFPRLVRRFIAKGGELIVTISNDSWFGRTSAPYQHLAMALFRSIENRRYMLRSTTNGVSAVVSSTGEILYRSPHHQEDRFIGHFKYLDRKTVFNRFGYLFPYLCAVLLLLYGVYYFIFYRED